MQDYNTDVFITTIPIKVLEFIPSNYWYTGKDRQTLLNSQKSIDDFAIAELNKLGEVIYLGRKVTKLEKGIIYRLNMDACIGRYFP